MFSDAEYAGRNQKNYCADAESHAKFGLNSTLYLAYRDVGDLLQKHLFDRNPKSTYKIFDHGCGAGLSTSIYAQIIREYGYDVEIFGADISEENLCLARTKVPEGTFLKIESGQSFDVFDKFDLVICNFVLVEHPCDEMADIIKQLQSLIDSNGVLITTNTTRQAYRNSNKWYTLDNDFKENTPQEFRDEKHRLKDDQSVSLAVKDPRNGEQLFRFFDFFHSGKAYKSAYAAAGLQLMQTHRPIGKETDGLSWRSENEFSPYKIHVLYPLVPTTLSFGLQHDI